MSAHQYRCIRFFIVFSFFWLVPCTRTALASVPGRIYSGPGAAVGETGRPGRCFLSSNGAGGAQATGKI